MKHLSLTILTLFIAFSSLYAQNAINVESILFEYDQFNLTENAKLQLDQILTINDVDSIQLTGHTDSDGEHDYNLRLSKKRVFSVQNYLVQHDFPNEKIILNYHGESIPLSDNNSENGRQQNRRVEITIFFKPEPIITKKIVEEKPKIVEVSKVDTIETIVEVIEDTTINIGGLKVRLTKNDFYAYNGTPVFEPILTVQDAMKYELNTMTTNGGLLVSDGMISLNPLPNSNCFTKPIKVYFPVGTSNIVGGKRKHYILTKRGWKVGGEKKSIDIVQIDNVSYYEMTIACVADGLGSFHNCDGKILESKHKLKLPVGYSLREVTFQYNQSPLGIYNYGGTPENRKLFRGKLAQKRKHKFALPCRMGGNPTNVLIKAHHKKTGKEIIQNISFTDLNDSVFRSKCKDCPKGLRMRIHDWKKRPRKKFRVKRTLLKS